MKRAAWIIRVTKTPEGKWRALKPVWSKRSGKPLLTQRALYKGTEIETPGGHWEIEWYEGGKRLRLRTGPNTYDAVKALAKQKLRLQAMEAGLVTSEPLAPKKKLLGDAIDEFLLEKLTTKSRKTWQAHNMVLTHFKQAVGKQYLEDLTRADMFRFIAALQRQGLAERTQDRKSTRLNSSH